MRSLWSKITATKPRALILEQEREGVLENELGLWDMLAIGIGGTIGSGVFVTTGLVAHAQAGPSVILCWLIGGLVCSISGLSYAEMSARLPCAGSTYAYSYYAIGELAAFVSGWLLTLEYGISGAAVARDWGDKVGYWVGSWGVGAADWLHDTHGNIAGALVQALVVLLLLQGTHVGTTFVKGMTVLKVLLVLFMIVVGLSLFSGEYLIPFLPKAHDFVPNPDDTQGGLTARNSFGIPGLLSGATSCFFGFIGFDEVCCMAAQVKNGGKVMPIAVCGTIAGVTALSTLASIALVGMASYADISASSGFASAFRANGYNWSAQITQAGEILTLPVVVMVAFLAQPQLQFAMAQDGLIPPIFAKTDSKKTLWWGTCLSGGVMVVVAACVPFTHLNDMISAGVLLSFNFTNSSLIIVRLHGIAEKHSGDQPRTLRADPKSVLLLYHVFALATAFLLQWSEWSGGPVANSTVLFSAAVALLLFAYLASVFSTVSHSGTSGEFRAPMVPALPCLGIFINYYLVSALSPLGLALIFGSIAIVVVVYFTYGYHHSVMRQGLNGKDLRHAREPGAVRVLLSSGETRFRDRQSFRQERSLSDPTQAASISLLDEQYENPVRAV